MVIAVTGAAGRVGGFVVDGSSRAARALPSIRRAATSRRRDAARRHPGPRHARRCASWLSAIVHLSRRSPRRPSPRTSPSRWKRQARSNCLEAAVKVGARKFVYASSEAVLGFAYRTRDLKPDYFPIDEEHPLRPQDSYGMSKMGWRPAAPMRAEARSKRFASGLALLLGDGARRRGDRGDSKPGPPTTSRSRSTSTCTRHRAPLPPGVREFRRRARDRLCGRARYPRTRGDGGADRAVYPGVTLRREMGPNDSLISGDRAREVFGFEPETFELAGRKSLWSGVTDARRRICAKVHREVLADRSPPRFSSSPGGGCSPPAAGLSTCTTPRPASLCMGSPKEAF